MSLKSNRARRAAWEAGVKHCTFDPEGPGVVRIHLIPPVYHPFRKAESLVILNGYYILPLGYTLAHILAAFIDEVNTYDGRPITEEAETHIFENTVRAVSKIYPHVRREAIGEDLEDLLEILFEVARGGKPSVYIEKLSVRSYAPYMAAPHRMDLMVAAMTDEEGCWKCNQKCRFCYAAGQSLGKSSEMTADEWKKVLDRLKQARVPMVTFTGGEPTLRLDILELVEYAKWFVTRLNTNGVALTDELVKGLKAASLDSLQVTLYSADPAIHNELTGAEYHGDTVEGIRRAVEAGLDVSVNTPLCRANADYVQTLALIHSLGVRFVTVSGLICTGGAAGKHAENDLTADELLEIVQTAKAFCDDHGMEMDFTSPGLIPADRLEELGMNIPSCGACLSNMAIAPDGTVVPCQSWLGTDAALGHILRDDWKQIWNHPACKSLRSMTDREALSCPFRARGEV